MTAFPTPTGGASLLLSFRLHQKSVLIIGGNALAASRAFSALEADSTVIVLVRGGVEATCEELRWRAQHNQATVVDLNSFPGTSELSVAKQDAERLDTYLSTTSAKISFVTVTDTLQGTDPALRRSWDSASDIAHICQKHGIPINVADMPDLCDFSFTSTHRFSEPSTNAPTSLQVGVTTNGQGCRLAGRLRRDIVSKLPKDVGSAVARVGKLRRMAQGMAAVYLPNGELNEDESVPTPNQPVPQRPSNETEVESARRRMKWVAQVSEYWPISRLATMTDIEMSDVLDGKNGLHSHLGSSTMKPQHHPGDSEVNSLHSLPLSPVSPPGRILLVGSGPGHPSLLTLATYAALTKHADLVLSDKLVPDAVLALVPSRVEVRIARKFPGNADGAQNELMEAAIEAVKRGLTVVRLKQGDPTVYGRAGEEVLYFRAHGVEPIVIPGVSSVLAGPTFAGIPVTQRGAAESFVVCTGVGRQGKEVKLPGYERSRTLVLLMGVARLPQILDTLQSSDSIVSVRRAGAAYPAHLPIALIERASMPDQRVVYSTLKDIAAGLESIGEQRPPGMLVVGWSILSLWKEGDVAVLEGGAEQHDEERIQRWLGGSKWRVSEGLEQSWEDLWQPDAV